MTNRDRFFRTMRYEPVDRRPFTAVPVWHDTLARWHREGLPEGVDPNEYLGLEPLRSTNISPNTGLHPPFETRTIGEDEEFLFWIDDYGRTVRDFKNHTSMPEWIDFPVKSREDLRRVIDEHLQIDNLDERFPEDWEQKVHDAAEQDTVILIDGGCYYWTLRSLTGVEQASYLFYDAQDEVDEFFERINIVVMEGIRRAMEIVKVDVVGFGEDIAYKNGPLISPTMFRQFILPRYRKVMDLAHSKGIDLTWYDSDGDLRQFIPDYLGVGINMIAPCEVAAGMAPAELRSTFGREMRLLGGIDKREIARGREAIDAELERNRPLIEEGGFIPGIDHSVSSDISWDNYRYFIDGLLRVTGNA